MTTDHTGPAGQEPGSEEGQPAREPVISVVIACYNAEHTLGEQLDALARQDVTEPFEVILADNGSTDGSAALARSYAAQGRLDLRVVDASGAKGPGFARNTGVMAARADLIAFCDADDVVFGDWLRLMLAALRTDRFVAGTVKLDRLNTEGVRRTRSAHQTDRLERSPVAGGLPHAGAGNMGLHREVFLGVNGFDESLRCLQDADLCWRIQLAGTPLAFHPEILIDNRLRSTVITIVKQGFLYGRSFAQLESRYDSADQDDAGQGEDGGPVRKIAGYLKDTGFRGMLWNVAWHLGHRHGAYWLRGQGAPAVRSSITAGAEAA